MTVTDAVRGAPSGAPKHARVSTPAVQTPLLLPTDACHIICARFKDTSILIYLHTYKRMHRVGRRGQHTASGVRLAGPAR